MPCRTATLLALLLCGTLGLGCGEAPDDDDYGAIGDDVQSPEVAGTEESDGDEPAGDETADDAVAAADRQTEPRDPGPESEEATSDPEPVDAEAETTAETDAVVDSAVVPASSVKPALEPQPVREPTKKPSASRGPQVLVESAEFRREDGDLRVTFDDLDLNRVLGIERPTADTPRHMPDWQTELDGKRIRIRGYMYPTESQSGLTYFTLVRDNMVCCFGPMAKIYDKISVKLREGETTDYIQNRPFDVAGTFGIEPYVIAGDLVQLYTLKDAVVLDK